jgi:hypothetical protein
VFEGFDVPNDFAPIVTGDVSFGRGCDLGNVLPAGGMWMIIPWELSTYAWMLMIFFVVALSICLSSMSQCKKILTLQIIIFHFT